MANLTRAERFALFLREMDAAPPAASFEAASAAMDATLNAIEDAHSGTPFDPLNWESDGRLYPPVDPYVVDAAGTWMARTVSHRVRIGANGAIRIERFGDAPRVELDKPGRDGAKVALD